MTRTGPLVALVILLSACGAWVTDILEFGSLEVRTVTRSGAPVSGSELVLYNDLQIMGVGFTGSDGVHRFDFVPPQFYGVHNEPPDGHMRPEDVMGGPSTAYVQGITMKEGDEQSISFTFVRVGPGRIDVSVTDPKGTPIEDTKVFLYGPEGTLSEKFVGSSGSVSFDSVSFGNRGIRVVPPRSYLDSDEGFFFQHGILIDEGWKEEVSFILEKCLGTVRGSVQDISGTPVIEHTVRLYSSTATLELKNTGADGLAVFDSIPCGNRGLSLVETPGWFFNQGRGLSFHDGISVSRGSDQTFSFTVEPCRGTVRGSVQDVSGAPVVEHTVRLYSSTATLELKDTGADGLAVFDSIDCGNRGLSLVETPGWSFEEGRGLSFHDGISVTHQSDQTFSFTVEPCHGTVRGSVQDISGAPVTEHPIRLYSSTATLELKDTGADGVAVFDSIPCGNFGIALVQRPGWIFEEGRGLSFDDGISVINQSDQGFSFSIESCSGEVGIRVEDQNSDPVSGALLELYATDRTWDQDITGADGVLTFTGACGMEVGVRVTPPAGYTVPEGRGSSFYDGLRPDIDGRVELVFRLQAS